MGCSLPGSSVHRIFQARILEWVAVSFSEDSSRTWSPMAPALAGGFFTTESPGKTGGSSIPTSQTNIRAGIRGRGWNYKGHRKSKHEFLEPKPHASSNEEAQVLPREDILAES